MTPTPKTLRQLREELGIPRIVVAVRAGVSEPSVKCYEANPDEGVTAPIRRKLGPVYAQLQAELAQREAS